MDGAATAGSVRDALSGAADAMRAAGADSPRLDAELLLAEATGWSRARLVSDPGAGVPAAAARRYGEMVRRRLRREPVAYILGRKGFRRIEPAVDRRVLIPRPETELLVELAVELRPRTVLDVGTGSGAVALAIADELPGSEVTATDTSPAALAVARANAERLGLSERVRFFEGTVPAGPSGAAGGSHEAAGFDLIVANLPYIAERDWAGLQPEVTEWEPREALLAGRDGLDAIRAVLPRCARCLSHRAVVEAGERRVVAPDNAGPAEGGAALAFEVGDGQAEAVAEMLRNAGLAGVAVRRDLAGIQRVVWGRR